MREPKQNHRYITYYCHFARIHIHKLSKSTVFIWWKGWSSLSVHLYTSIYRYLTQIRYNIYCFSIIQFVFQISFVHFSKCQPSSTSAISVCLSAYMCMSCFLLRWPKRTCHPIPIRCLVAPWLSVCPENVLQIHFTSLMLVVMVRLLLLAGMAACYSNGLRIQEHCVVQYLHQYQP